MHIQVLYKYNSSIAQIFVIKNTIKPILPLKDIPKSQNILNCRQKKRRTLQNTVLKTQRI